MTELTRRIAQIERHFAVEEKYVHVPLPGRPDTAVRLRKVFVDFIIEKLNAARGEDGRYWNRTDERWDDL